MTAIFRDANGCPEIGYGSNDTYYGYTTIYFNEFNKTNDGNVLQKPPEVLRNLIQTEVSPSSDEFDQPKLLQALISNRNIDFSLSINEVESSREIIEKMCSQSRMFFRYRARDSKPIVETLKNTYTNVDVSKTIDPENMLSFSYSKTKFEDLCIGGCLIKYGKNYVNNSFAKETTKKELDDDTLGAYKEYYNISDEKNHILEVEAPYIQDKSSALELRDYLFELNKNQHLTCKFKLSIRDGLELEPGDIIDFLKDPIDVKPYGNSIVGFNTKIDQIVYPYFIITSVSKKESEIDIEVYQLHELNPMGIETTILGDINLDGEVDYRDRDLLLSYIMGQSYLTDQQIANADINQDGVINIFDVSSIEDLEYYNPVAEEEHIDDVFEQLRGRLHQVLETVNLEADEFSNLPDSFYYNTESDPIIFTGQNSFVAENPYPEISIEITKYIFTVYSEVTQEIVDEFESDDPQFTWDVSNLSGGQGYRIRLKVEAEAVEYGYHGEQRTLVSDTDDGFLFYFDTPTATDSVFVPVLNINGESENLYTSSQEPLVLSAEDSYFRFQDGSIDEYGGEVTSYWFHCVYLYNNTNQTVGVTAGNILFSDQQESPIYEIPSGLYWAGRYMCFLWAQSPNGVWYSQDGQLAFRPNIVMVQVG